MNDIIETIKDKISNSVENVIYNVICAQDYIKAQIEKGKPIEVITDIEEVFEEDFTSNTNDTYLYSDMEHLFLTNDIKSILPRLDFKMNIDRTEYPSVEAAIHNVQMQVDIFTYFEFILSPSGTKSIKLTINYKGVDEVNTKGLVRVINEAEFAELGLSMLYKTKLNILVVKIMDSLFEILLDNQMQCSEMTHILNNGFVETITRNAQNKLK